MIEDFYESKLNIPKKIVNLLSIELILKGCAEGLSNKRIALRYGLKLKEVSSSLEEFFYFGGWNIDLDFSPIAIYNKINGNYEAYKREVIMISPASFDKYIDDSFYVCEIYSKVKKEIDKYYG